MEFRSKKIAANQDQLGAIAQGIVLEATSRKLELISGNAFSGNGDGILSRLYVRVVAAPGRWRVVGIGGNIYGNGHDQVAEMCQWGYKDSDLGATLSDAFGEVTMDNDAGDAWNSGEILYQGISPYEDFFGFDALADSVDTWDISGAGAGVSMGDWQTKATLLMFTKLNVANSDTLVFPFFLVEYETGEGVL